ncbi:MAG: rhodanese-like domain-containing protein [Spirochaetes bacterium]|nr:rhodanese-like domain-containing protein [Spirochaetota bacterium]
MKTASKYLSLLLTLVLAMAGLAACRRPAPLFPVEEFVAGDLGRVISAAQLQALLEYWEPNLVVIGAISPFTALLPAGPAGAIDGSYLIWRPDITADSSPAAISPEIAGMGTSQAEIENLLSRAGVTGNSRIVVYSENVLDSSRLMWLLSMLGMEKIHYLDGGINAWIAAGYPTGSGVRLPGLAVRNNFQSPDYDYARVAAPFALVVEALQNPDEWVVIDARTAQEFAGERVPASGGAFGTGRIANTVNINWVNNIDPATGLIRSREELEAVYGDVIRGRNVIVFCQSGLRASHTWFVLREVLGHDMQVLLWDGSWIEWSFAASAASGGQFPGILEMTEEWTDNGGAI